MNHPPSHQPRKPRSIGQKIGLFGCLPAFAILGGLIGLGAIVGDDTTTSSSGKGAAAPETPRPDRDAVREAAGLPTEPSPAARQAYLDALNAIDPRIIKPGKADQAVSRGINQCSSVKSFPDDEEKLAELALERFTITTRLPEIATMDTGKKVVAAVREHICPDF